MMRMAFYFSYVVGEGFSRTSIALTAIKAYRDAIANEATIERKVAGSLQIRTKVRTSFGNDFRGYDRDLPP